MAISAKKKAEIEGLIVRGMDIRDITDKTKVARATVYSIRKELIEGSSDRDITTLSQAAPAILAEVATDIRNRAPIALEEEVEKLLDAAQSLQRLETNFHESFELILIRAKALLNQDNLSVLEWTMITNTLSSAFKDVFHTKGTTINVGQAGSVGSNSLTMFQSRMGN